MKVVLALCFLAIISFSEGQFESTGREPIPIGPVNPKSTDGCPASSCKRERLLPSFCRKANYFQHKGLRCRGCDGNKCRGKLLRVAGNILRKAIRFGGRDD